jgi:glycosyltransferase involved in cell wall biosynthesis
MKITIVRECNEIPSFVDEKKFQSYHHFLLKLKMRMYNSIIVISDQLNYIYSSILPKDRIIQIPILVDFDRFKNVELKDHPGKIITYVGYMGGNKDGLENLIEAMALVKKKNEKTTLQLVGSAPEKDMIRLKNKVRELGLYNIVHFLGRKNAKEIPYILLNSDYLVLARPNNSQAKAGFPTKLGEYLASAKPIIITITGEIPKYLTDKESAYLSKPDDIVDFADKLVYALSDENAEKIGREGYKIARNNFNYKLYGKKLVDFLQN